MIVIAGKMQNRTANHDIGRPSAKRHLLHRLHSKILRGKRGSKRSRQPAHVDHSPRIGVDAKNLKPRPQQINKVAAKATPCIQNPHPWRNSPTQKLVEKVNINLAKLRAKV